MRTTTKFNGELEEVWYNRARWLMNVLDDPGDFEPPAYSSQERDTAIARLQKLASEALAVKLAREYFDENLDEKKTWRITKQKGHGWRAKRDSFNEWFDDNVSSPKFVYAFWNGASNCLYVGKTGSGSARPTKHFEKHWFSRSTRIDLFTTERNRSLAAMECLGIHRWNPTYNRSKAETKKWTDKCPLCSIHEGIEKELKSIFSISRR